MNKHPFITIEGIDGAGKSTVRNLLMNYFEAIGIKPFIVGQHSWLNVEIARQIVNIRESRCKFDRASISNAYALDKKLHSEFNIKPALKNTVVLADRYILSDAVYHDILYKIPFQKTIEKHLLLKTIRPDLILYVETKPEIAYKRLEKRSKRIQHYGRLAKLEPIQKKYNSVLQYSKFFSSIPLVKFNNDKDGISEKLLQEVWPKVLELL